MRRLGAVLAGGASSRFGADKALAEIDGVALIDRAIAALRPHCDAVAVVGRKHRDFIAIADRPSGNLGPLGGLAGALHYATAHGFADVLTVPCDVPFPPERLFAALRTAPAVIAEHPVFGLWPVDMLDPLDDWLAADRPRAIHALARAIDAQFLSLEIPIRDVDTPADLALVS